MQLCSPLDAITLIKVVQTPLYWYYYTERVTVRAALAVSVTSRRIDVFLTSFYLCLHSVFILFMLCN